MIEAAIATRNTATLETLIEGGGLTPAEQALAESALNQIQILNNSIASVSRLAQLLNRTVKQVKQAIEKCKQANLPKSGPVRNPDVVVNPATGEVYPLTPNGGVGDSIGDINEFLPPK